MGILKGALKLAGSAALGAVGAAATLVREAGNATGSDLLADIAGTIQDASFEKARDMLGMDGAKEIDGMNLDELGTYISRLTDEMDDDERMEFYDAINAINENETDESEREAQIRELVKGTAKVRAQAKRAEDRAAKANRNAELFNQRCESERKKVEKE